MYRSNSKQMSFMDFGEAFGLDLEKNNRWVILGNYIPWDELEKIYKTGFPSHLGTPAKPLRLMLGALIIQEMYQYSDREVVNMIRESPYLQYFCGYRKYESEHDPFHPSLLVIFRKRLDEDMLCQINELIGNKAEQDQIFKALRNPKRNQSANREESKKEKPSEEDHSEPAQEAASDKDVMLRNAGTLILDATCTPAYLRYPQDTSLLNEARERLEGLIDKLHAEIGGKKPRTYRQQAHRDYVAFARKRKPGAKVIRRQIRKQLSYLRRDLKHIEKMLQIAPNALRAKDLELLGVLETVFRQQEYMYKNKVHRVDDRIVSIEEYWIRPIVRGKAKAPTEFGPKIHISLNREGMARIEKFSFDAFNEALELEECVNRYHERYGCWPEAVLADQIYRTRSNIAFCKEHGIRLSGKPLGRPKKDPEVNKQIRAAAQKDGIERIEIEREISTGKRCCGMGLIMTRRIETQRCSVFMAAATANIRKILRVLLNEKQEPENGNPLPVF